MEGTGHVLTLRYYLSICLEGLRNTVNSLSQDSQSLGQDLNPVPPEFEAGVLTIWLLHLV
jgi:hypothetical protein